MYVTYQRLTNAYFFNTGVHKANICYDILLTILFLVTGAQDLSGVEYSIISLVVILCTAIAIAIFFLFISNYRKSRETMAAADILDLNMTTTESKIMRIIYRL